MTAEKSRISGELIKSGAGIELGLGAVIFGLLGLWLDSKLNTTPLLLIGFFLFGFLGAGFALFYRFKEQIRQDDVAIEESKRRDSGLNE